MGAQAPACSTAVGDYPAVAGVPCVFVFFAQPVCPPAGPDGEEQLLYMNSNRDEVATNILSYEPAADGSITAPSECCHS